MNNKNMNIFLIASCLALLSVSASDYNYNQERKPSIEETPNGEFSKSTQFASEFQAAIRNSKELYTIFFSGLEEAKDYNVLYTELYNEGVGFKSDDPDEFAKTISDSFSAVLDIMTPTIWSKALATGIERLLNYYGVTLTVNASQLSKQLANNIKNAGRTIRSVSFPGDFLKAVIVGAAKFIISFIEASPVAATAFSKFISEEFNSLKYY